MGTVYRGGVSLVRSQCKCLLPVWKSRRDRKIDTAYKLIGELLLAVEFSNIFKKKPFYFGNALK